MSTLLPPPSSLHPNSRLYAYLRDSGHEDQELSIEQQENSIRAWCSENNLVLQKIFRDEARPGSTDENRPQLAEMMHALRHGADVAGVVVWSSSRISRNAIHSQYYRSEIRMLGYTYHSITDRASDGPEAIIFEALIDYKNQQYLHDMSVDVKRGLRQLVEQFGCVPGVPPRGFKREPVEIGRHRDGRPRTAHRWVIDPDVAPLVRQAFKMRAAGASLGQIQRETRLYGSINSYRTFWPNKLYLGILEYGDLVIADYCAPIVDQKTFDIVQAIQGHYAGHHRVSSASKRHPRRVNSSYLLSGLAYCARCESPLFGRSSVRKNGTRLTAYFCTRAYRKRDCSKHRIPGKALENTVLEKLREVYLRPEYLAAIRQEYLAQLGTAIEDQDQQRRVLTGELGKVRRKIDHLANAIAESGHTQSLLKRLEGFEARQAELLTQLAAHDNARTQPLPQIPPEQLAEYLEDMLAIFERGSLEDQRGILRGILESVFVDREENRLFGVINVYYPPGYDPPKANPPSKGGMYAYNPMPVGAAFYRHTISFDCPARSPRSKAG